MAYPPASSHSSTLQASTDENLALSTAKGSACLCMHIRAIETARRLLGHGAEVDALDGRGRSGLHRAAGAGELEMVKLLLGWGASVAPDAQGNSLLAAAHAHPAILRALWQAGAAAEGLRGRAAEARGIQSAASH